MSGIDKKQRDFIINNKYREGGKSIRPDGGRATYAQ